MFWLLCCVEINLLCGNYLVVFWSFCCTSHSKVTLKLVIYNQRTKKNSVLLLFGCISIIWLCFSYLVVFQLFGCVFIIWLCFNYLILFWLFCCTSHSKSTLKLGIYNQTILWHSGIIIWLCLNYLVVIKLFGCV